MEFAGTVDAGEIAVFYGDIGLMSPHCSHVLLSDECGTQRGSSHPTMFLSKTLSSRFSKLKDGSHRRYVD